MSELSGGSAGPSTDRHNDPVIDPTKNVLDLVSAETKRQDDLRMLEGDWRDRFDKMQIDHAWEIRKAESDRIDAILDAGAANVQRAADVQSGVAAQLAGQVASTATAFEARLIGALQPIQQRIDDLTRAQYEGVGAKTQVVEARATGGSIALWVGVGIAALAIMFTFFTIVISIIALYLTFR